MVDHQATSACTLSSDYEYRIRVQALAAASLGHVFYSTMLRSPEAERISRGARKLARISLSLDKKKKKKKSGEEFKRRHKKSMLNWVE